MKTANLFQVVNSDSEDVALFQSTNSSMEYEWVLERISNYFNSEHEDFQNDTELEHYGIVRVFVNTIDIP